MSGTTGKILVVEDVRHVARLLQYQLEKAGFETRVVHDGAQVIEAVDVFQPHAVLLDVVLPNRSGLDICRELKNDAQRKGLVVFLVTGHPFADCQDEANASHADWHFSKPLSPLKLRQKLEEFGVTPIPHSPSDCLTR